MVFGSEHKSVQEKEDDDDAGVKLQQSGLKCLVKWLTKWLCRGPLEHK